MVENGQNRPKRHINIVITFEKNPLFIPTSALAVSCPSAPYCIVYFVRRSRAGVHFSLAHQKDRFFAQEGLKIIV